MSPTATIPEIADKPPDYDFVIFHKSRPEVWGSRTVGATDQSFLPERESSGSRRFVATAPMSLKYQIDLPMAQASKWDDSSEYRKGRRNTIQSSINVFPAPP
jgi:hypothetical protein